MKGATIRRVKLVTHKRLKRLGVQGVQMDVRLHPSGVQGGFLLAPSDAKLRSSRLHQSATFHRHGGMSRSHAAVVM